MLNFRNKAPRADGPDDSCRLFAKATVTTRAGLRANKAIRLESTASGFRLFDFRVDGNPNSQVSSLRVAPPQSAVRDPVRGHHQGQQFSSRLHQQAGQKSAPGKTPIHRILPLQRGSHPQRPFGGSDRLTEKCRTFMAREDCAAITPVSGPYFPAHSRRALVSGCPVRTERLQAVEARMRRE